MMRAFVDGDSCRWASLTGYLGSSTIVACGHCDVCRRDGLSRRTATGTRRVRHQHFGDGVVIASDDATLTVLFDDHGYRTLAQDLVDEGDLLVHLD